MKIILLESLKKYGKKGDVLEVSDGYAKNYLIKNGIARMATKNNLQINNQFLKHQKEKEDEINNDCKFIYDQINNKEITLFLKMNNSKTFGSVTSVKIMNSLNSNFQTKINKKMFFNFKPLNNIGKYNVKLKINKNLIANVIVNIQPN